MFCACPRKHEGVPFAEHVAKGSAQNTEQSPNQGSLTTGTPSGSSAAPARVLLRTAMALWTETSRKLRLSGRHRELYLSFRCLFLFLFSFFFWGGGAQNGFRTSWHSGRIQEGKSCHFSFFVPFGSLLAVDLGALETHVR